MAEGEEPLPVDDEGNRTLLPPPVAGEASAGGGPAAVSQAQLPAGQPPLPPPSPTQPPAPLLEPAVEERLRRHEEQMAALTQSLGRLLEALPSASDERDGNAGQRGFLQPEAHPDASSQVEDDSEVNCDNLRRYNAALARQQWEQQVAAGLEATQVPSQPAVPQLPSAFAHHTLARQRWEPRVTAGLEATQAPSRTAAPRPLSGFGHSAVPGQWRERRFGEGPEDTQAPPKAAAPPSPGAPGHSAVHRLLSRTIPVFDSERGSIDTFLRALDGTLSVMGPVDPESESVLLLQSLDARAQESLFAAGLDYTTPARKLRDFLRRRFGASSDVEAAADDLDMIVRGAQESIWRFADRVALLARRAETPARFTVRAFLRGCGTPEFVRVIGSLSLSQGDRDALTLESLCEKFDSGRARGLWPEFPLDGGSCAAHVCGVAPNSRWPATAPNLRPRDPFWHGRCFCCRQKGHSVYECPLLECAPPPAENDGR